MKRWMLILIVAVITIGMTGNLKAQVTVRDSVEITGTDSDTSGLNIPFKDFTEFGVLRMGKLQTQTSGSAQSNYAIETVTIGGQCCDSYLCCTAEDSSEWFNGMYVGWYWFCVDYAYETACYSASWELPVVHVQVPEEMVIEIDGLSGQHSEFPNLENLGEYGEISENNGIHLVQQGNDYYFFLCNTYGTPEQTFDYYCSYDGDHRETHIPTPDLAVPSVTPYEEDNYVYLNMEWIDYYPGNTNQCGILFSIGPHLKSFEVTFSPDTIQYSETSTITVQGKDDNGDDIDPAADDTWLLFELDSIGSCLGHLSGYNAEGVTYGYVKAGGVKFVADGEEPDNIETVKVTVQNWDNLEIKGEGQLVVKPVIHYFQVLANPDTICHSNTSILTVQGKGKDDNDIDLPDDTVLLFELDSIGSRLGHLVDYDTNGVTYAFAKAGGVKFVADGEEPDNIETVNIKVLKKEDSEINGEGKVVVEPNIKLGILKPSAEEIRYITPKPEMPVIPCEAKLSGYNGGENPVVNWECKVRYDYPPGSDERTYTEDKSFNSNYISEWNLNFDSSATIIGGKATIKAKTTISGQEYIDSVIVYIRGTNPDRSTVIKGLSNGIEALVETESAGTYHQFGNETYAKPNEGLPLNTGNDWGMCQINECNGISTAILWDWTANLSRAQELFNGWVSTALAELQAQVSPGTNIPQLVLDCQTYAHYQGGTIAGAYQWVVDDNHPLGYWDHNPTNADGDEGLVITGNTNYRNNWGN